MSSISLLDPHPNSRYAEHLASEPLGNIERGDAIGMRLTADRSAIAIFVIEKARTAAAESTATTAVAATAATATTPIPTNKPQLERVLKVCPEVIAFPLKVMLVFGSAPSPIGPLTWLKSAPKLGDDEASARERAVRGRKDGLDNEGEGSVLEHVGPKTVKGRHAGQVLDQGTVDANGNVLVLQAAGAGSWAAGIVQRVEGAGVEEDLFAALPELAKAKGKAQEQQKKKEDLKRKRKAAAIAAAPRAVAKASLIQIFPI